MKVNVSQSAGGVLLVLMAMSGLPGCELHRKLCDESAPHSIRPRPQVVIFRGLGGYMPGSSRLQQKLAACGITATVTCNPFAHDVSRCILERRAQGDRSPIVLMGYAVGGWGTRRVANDLARHGICVDGVILIDPSFFEPVPCNVRYCCAAYKPAPLQTWNPLMRGEPVRTESCKTVVNRMNLDEHDPHGLLNGYNHLTVTTNEWVQDILVQQAAGVVFGSDCQKPVPAFE